MTGQTGAELRATCPCGALVARTAAAPIRVSICHCDACRRRTGSAFSWNLRFDDSEVTIEGDAREWSRRGDEGATIRDAFCPTCGGSPFYRNDDLPGMIALRGGALGRSAPPPGVSVYHDRCPDWLQIEGVDRWS